MSIALTCPTSEYHQEDLSAGEDTQLRNLGNMPFDGWQSSMEEDALHLHQRKLMLQ